MKTTVRFMVSSVGASLLWLAAPAHAENFVEVFLDEEAEIFAEVDVDSIRKDSDGLVYFRISADIGSSDRAVDCGRRVLYLLKDDFWSNANWRENGNEVIADSVGAAILDFACAHSP